MWNDSDNDLQPEAERNMICLTTVARARFATKIRNISLLLVNVMLLQACASLPPLTNQSPSFTPSDTDTTVIGQSTTRQSAENPGKSGFLLLADGLDAYVARANLIKHAERTIDVQYYFIRYDFSGTLFMGLLAEAAERGIRVRVLLDDYYLADKDDFLLALDSHPNIEIRAFNPFPRSQARATSYITEFNTVSRRMHNKSFTVDNQVTIVGGRNVGDEYFAADTSIKFNDLDVLAIGPIVKDTSAAFDLYWNHKLARNMRNLLGTEASPEETLNVVNELLSTLTDNSESDYVKALKASKLTQQITSDTLPLRWSESSLLADSPDKLINDRSRSDLQIILQIKSLLASATQEILIVSPYFIPGKNGSEFLTGLAKKGVKVRILTNSAASNNVAVVHAHYSRYRKRLLRDGVDLHEVKRIPEPETAFESDTLFTDRTAATLHATFFVIDKKITYIGSLNMDARSVYENTEMGIVIHSPEIGKGVSNWFENNKKRIAYDVKLDDNKLIWIETTSDGSEILF